MSGFKLTEKQQEALQLAASDITHLMLFGGSRSGKTFIHIRNVVLRALKAPDSRHAVLRFRFNHVKQSVVLDTFPKVMRLCFPGVPYDIDKTNWYAKFTNGSEIWFGGLDDKDRTEKILGMEFVTIFLNECSQITWSSVGIVRTRLAQSVEMKIEGRDPVLMRPRMYYDCNPPSKAHWTYNVFVLKRDPETRQTLNNKDEYAALQMNPGDNVQNLAAGYLAELENLSARQRKRFLSGEFADATPNQLFPEDVIDTWRRSQNEHLPDYQRVVVAVDPSGSGEVENADNDAIGIMVVALGTDGNAYVLEDCTVKAGPGTWGSIAVSAWDRHDADCIVGEINYGGAMVEHVIKTTGTRALFKPVHASRGKAVRAEPFSALYEQGKVRHVGDHPDLEAELVSFSTLGYLGDGSPNRADALIWALAELFPGLIRKNDKLERQKIERYTSRNSTSYQMGG